MWPPYPCSWEWRNQTHDCLMAAYHLCMAQLLHLAPSTYKRPKPEPNLYEKDRHVESYQRRLTRARAKPYKERDISISALDLPRKDRYET